MPGKRYEMHPDFFVFLARLGICSRSGGPPLPPGMVRSVEINAAAHFCGYTDEWPDAEMTESLERAREVLAAGIAQLAIEKARRRG